MSDSQHTPTPWGWQQFGKEWCLTGQYSMRPIVLAVRKGRLTNLSPDHLLIPFAPEHPDSVFIVEACNSHDALTRERDAWKARAEKAESQRDALKAALKGCLHHLDADGFENCLEAVQARAALAACEEGTNER